MINRFTLFIILLVFTNLFSQIPIISNINPNPTFENSTLTISGTDLGSVTGLSVGIIEINSITNNTLTDFECVLPSIAAGVYDIVVTTPGGVSSIYSLTVSSPPLGLPTITGLSSPSGEVDDFITISGVNFESITGVYFGTTAINLGNILSLSNSALQIKIPVLPQLGNYDLTISNSSGNSSAYVFSVSGFNFPQTGSISPTNAVNGDRITFTGSNFESITGVLFGNSIADMASFTVINDNSFSIVIPFLTLGSHSVSVINARGTGNSTNLTITLAAPTISDIEPVNANVGDKITITGTSFVNPLSVIFNLVTVNGVRLISSTKLEVIAPNGLASGSVKVITPYGNYSAMQTVSITEVVGTRPDNVLSVLGKENASNFNIFPNPTNGSFYVQSEENGNLEIYNLAGMPIYSENFIAPKQYFLPSLSKGVYFIKIGIQVRKLVVE